MSHALNAGQELTSLSGTKSPIMSQYKVLYHICLFTNHTSMWVTCFLRLY